MTTTDASLNRLAVGDSKVDAAAYAFRTYAFAMLAGTLVTIAGFVPVGFAASSAGEYTFSLFAVVSISLIVSWFVAVIFAPLLGVAILTPPRTSLTSNPGRVLQWYQGFLTAAMRGNG
jgi:multidrug efflux pump subunit AcrB